MKSMLAGKNANNMEKKLPLLLIMCCGLLLAVSGCLLPSDQQLSKRLEQSVQNQLHPRSISVSLRRTSSLSTNVKWLKITMAGFITDKLPITIADRPAESPDRANHLQLLALEQQPTPPREQFIHLDKIRVQCDNFIIRRLPVKQLTLLFLHVQAPRSAMEDGQFAIHTIASATGSITFDERGLSQFLQTRNIALRNPKVRLTKTGCTISGETKGLLHAHVEIFGRPTIRNAGILYLDKMKMKVSVLTLPKEVSERLLSELNPLVDMNEDLNLPVPVYITKTALQSGNIRFEGVLDFPKTE